jgi:hypothetical protein
MRDSLRVLTVISVLVQVAPAVVFGQPRAAGVQPAAAAQAPGQRGRLVVTVVDQTNAIIPGAQVSAAPMDPSPASGTPAPPAPTDERGQITIDALVPGRYTIRAEFPGFETRILSDVRVRAGDNKHVVVLAVERLQDSVTVGRDKQAAAVDPRGDAFGTALTREQIEALSDDPDEMRRQLMDMAGPDAVLKIDSFEGGRLPPKAQIKAIRISRDAFAAEHHFAGGIHIEVITQPGMGPIRGGGNYRIRDGSMTGRNPFAQRKGPERSQSFGGHFGGTLIKGKSTFSLSLNGTTFFETPILTAALPTGVRSETLNFRRPRENMYAYGLFDYALTKDQVLRVSFNTDRSSGENLGIGGYDLPERAYSNSERYYNLRIQEVGPLGRRFFINTRASVTWNDSESTSNLEAPTIRVIDAVTFGGAQVAGGRHSRNLNLASDLDYVRGIHAVRTGIVLDGTSFRSDDSSNYLGTYTFESNDDYLAGRARSYTRRIGDPHVQYWMLQAGLYIQDDIKLRKNFVLSPGLRYEAQTHMDDVNNFAPRIGMNWSPGASGKTTIRASWGLFYDWLNTNTYEQTLRVDGFRQRELNIVNPSYPDPGSVGVSPPINRYLLGDDLPMARTSRVSVGVSHRVSPRLTAGATYSNSRGSGLMRGANLNAPVDGIRPDSLFGNIVEVVSDAKSKVDTLNANLNVSLSTPSPSAARRRFEWKRMSINGFYTLSRSRNNSDGPFSVPVTGDLALEWGPSNGDVRHRGNLGINSQAVRNVNMNLNMNVGSAPPYTIRTGRDDNGDLLFTDRPEGVGRNSARGRGQFTINGNFNYTIPLGRRRVTPPPGISITSVGGNVTVNQMALPEQARYRLVLTASIQNLTNRRNYVGYNGTMTSGLFGQPTSIMSPRRVDVGMSVGF